MPSELYNVHNPGDAEPHMVDTPPQQGELGKFRSHVSVDMVNYVGATMPGSGSEVHEEGKVPFKDQMIGMGTSPISRVIILILRHERLCEGQSPVLSPKPSEPEIALLLNRVFVDL